MTVSDLAKKTVQPIGWRDDNTVIPEEDINDIVQCATNMPAALLTLPTKKPFKIWIPHREGELSNALSCASVWAMDQCQDQTFNNASTVLVYMMNEPDHLQDKTSSVRLNKIPKMQSNIPEDHIMDEIIQQDWNSTKKIIDDQKQLEKDKKENFNYDTPPMLLNPFADWGSEHLSGLNLSIGMAMGAVSLRCRELGYYCQFYTAYRQTVDWHNQYGNKFQKDGKWFPYMLQIIGTKPEAGKMSSRMNLKQINDETHTVDPNTKADTDPLNQVDQGIEIFKPKMYREFVKEAPRTIPNSTIEFFMEHYGKYARDPKDLFHQAFGRRVKHWAKLFDQHIKK
jgi:hypothetical protein